MHLQLHAVPRSLQLSIQKRAIPLKLPTFWHCSTASSCYYSKDCAEYSPRNAQYGRVHQQYFRQGTNREKTPQQPRNSLVRVGKAGLRLMSHECACLTKTVEYVGHTISPEGLKPSGKRVEQAGLSPALTGTF